MVRGLENLPDESVDGLLAYAAAPVEDVALVLVHGGGPKGSGVLTKLRKLGPVTESKSGELRASEYPCFVAAEVRSHGAKIDSEAAAVLVQAVGQDLRSLAAAADQLTNDFPGQALTIEKVKQYFGGRAEAKSFAVADAAFWGRREAALEELRWALDAGTAPVLVTSAFAGGARGVARYRSAPRGMREADLAREVGVPPWKLRTIRDQARGWSDACDRPRDPGRGPRRRRHQGRRQRRVVHPRAAGAHRHRPARPALSPRQAPGPRGSTQKGAVPEGAAPISEGPQREAAFLEIADLRLAAWFLWMTPLETALSSLRAASRPAASATSLSPASAASRNLRTAVFRPVLTALLRSCRFSFCLFRLIWDLMFATTAPSS